MNRRAFIAGTMAGCLLAAPLAAEAQQAGKVWRIGYLATQHREAQTYLIQAFEGGLREKGYTPGRDILIEYRFADGRVERLPELAAELVRLKVDVIVTGVNPGSIAAKKATTTIPIVMAGSFNPVEDGLVASLAPSWRERHRPDAGCRRRDPDQTPTASQGDQPQTLPRRRSVGYLACRTTRLR